MPGDVYQRRVSALENRKNELCSKLQRINKKLFTPGSQSRLGPKWHVLAAGRERVLMKIQEINWILDLVHENQLLKSRINELEQSPHSDTPSAC